MALITLTTDFGEGTPYVAAMKGVILTLNPEVHLVDLTHSIPPQDVRRVAFFLAAALPYFPGRAIHVVVVDPGVGTERAVLLVEAEGMKLVVPDNGCWTMLSFAKPPLVRRLENSRFWRAPVSATFHGRDIFAPVAATLSLGQSAEALGPRTKSWVRLDVPQPRQVPDGWEGEVLFVDSFGNLITNIPIERVREQPARLRVGKRSLRSGFRCVRTYGEAPPGSLVVLGSSTNLMEVAVVQGSAARKLGADLGTPIGVYRRPSN